MICAKNYETVFKFVKAMPEILWPLFSRTRCRNAGCYCGRCHGDSSALMTRSVTA